MKLQVWKNNILLNVNFWRVSYRENTMIPEGIVELLLGKFFLQKASEDNICAKSNSIGATLKRLCAYNLVEMKQELEK